jgi:hypothetical protein
LRKHGATSAEIPVYVSYIRELLNQSSYSNYEEKFEELKDNWSQPFLEYYMKTFHAEIATNLGRFVLESMDLYHPYTGVTNNQSESFNAVLKRLQRWREVPVDSIILSLYHLQAYYHNEIQRGFAGLGNYRLLPQFANAARSVDEISLISTYSPEEIVEKIILYSQDSHGSSSVKNSTEGPKVKQEDSEEIICTTQPEDDIKQESSEENICTTRHARAK